MKINADFFKKKKRGGGGGRGRRRRRVKTTSSSEVLGFHTFGPEINENSFPVLSSQAIAIRRQQDSPDSVKKTPKKKVDNNVALPEALESSGLPNSLCPQSHLSACSELPIDS